MSDFWRNHEALKKYPELLSAVQRSDSNLTEEGGQKVYTDILAAWKKNSDVFSTEFISFTEKKPAAIMGVELFDKESGRLLQTDYISSQDISMLEGLSLFKDVVEKKNKYFLKQKTHFMWLEPDGTIKTKDCEQDFEFLDEEIVESTTVSAPRAKDGKKTIVLYGREPFQRETEDYYYMDNHTKDGKVRALLPVSGEVKFHEGFEIKEVCFDEANAPTLQLLFETGDEPISYAGDYKKAFRIEGQTIHFKFDEDWGTDIDIHRFQASTVMNLHLVFKVTVIWETMPYTLSIVVESLDKDHADTPTTAIIEPISIRWGCLGEDTRIRMADGREQLISQIRCGDMVMTPNGYSRVIDIFRGLEETIVHLETAGGKQLEATDSHPVQTKRGVIPVSELRGGDEVQTEWGEYEPVTALYTKDYQKIVYNLYLEDEDHLFVANEIVTGDFEAQNTITWQKKRPWSDEVRGLRDKMRQMAEELKK